MDIGRFIRSQWTVLVLVALLVGGTIAVALFWPSDEAAKAQTLAGLLAFVAALIVALVTWAYVKTTQDILEAAKNQVEGMARPALVFLSPDSPEIAHKPVVHDCFHVLNIGSGPAFRIAAHVASSEHHFAYLQSNASEALPSVTMEVVLEQVLGGREVEMEVTYFSLSNVRYRSRAKWQDARIQPQPIERVQLE